MKGGVRFKLREALNYLEKSRKYHEGKPRKNLKSKRGAQGALFVLYQREMMKKKKFGGVQLLPPTKKKGHRALVSRLQVSRWPSYCLGLKGNAIKKKGAILWKICGGRKGWL